MKHTMVWYVLSITLLAGFFGHGRTEQALKPMIQDFNCYLSCDIRDTSKNCTELYITGINLFANTSCIYYTGITGPTGNVTTNATTVTSSQILCNLPNEVGRNGIQFREYIVRLSNDGLLNEENETLGFLVFDSHCVQCNKYRCNATWECIRKDGLCIDEGVCYNNGYVDPQNECRSCESSRSNTTLVYKQDTGLTCKEYAVQLTCNETEMSAYVNKDMFLTDNLEFSLSSCADSKKTGESVTAKFSDCANSREDGGWVIQENTLTVSASYVSPPTQRDVKYTYKLECKFNRTSNISLSTPTLVQDEEAITQAIKTVESQFSATMKLYTSNLFNLVHGPPFEYTMFEPIYVRVEAVAGSDDLKFVTQECYATPSNEQNNPMRYDFFDEKCELIDSFREYDTGGRKHYDFSIDAFKFISTMGSIYLHCKVLICKTNMDSDECRQQCGLTRSRRSLSSGVVHSTTVRSGQLHHKVKSTCRDVTCPKRAHCLNLHPAQCRCDDGYLMDFKTRECISENLFIVTGLHLDVNYLPAYTDPSSNEFLRFAINVEHQLATLFSLDYRFVKGVKVTGVAKGSAVLDFLIACSSTKTTEEAFDSFVKTVMEVNRDNNGGMKRVNVIRGIMPKMKQIQRDKRDNSSSVQIIALLAVLVLFLVAGITILVNDACRKHREYFFKRKILKVAGFSADQ